MVPKPTGWFKSNKSHTSVDNSSGQPSPVLSVNNEFQNPNGQQQAQLGQQPPSQQPPLGVAQQQYRPPQQQPFPQRTTSTSHNHRLSSHDQLHGYQQSGGPPDPSPGFEQARPSPQQLPAPVYTQEQPKKPSRLSRIAAGLTGHKEEDASKQAKKDTIGRRQSTRGRETRPQDYQQQQQQDAPHLTPLSQQYHQRTGSQQQLPTSVEQDEGSPGLDPFLQQDPNTPEVPPKDHQYQQHTQQFVPNSHQGQYNRPPLDRVSTEGSYQKQGGVEHYSPDQHQGPQLQQPQAKQHQYPNYQPVAQQSQNSDAYQPFPPQSAPSPRPANAQLYGQDTQQQQRNVYYQQQQAAQPSQGQSQGQPPQDGHPQNGHPQNGHPQNGHPQNNHFQQQQQQQQQFAPPPQPQPQQPQDFRQQHAHPVRTASLHQPELQHPQAARGVPQIVQGGQPVDQQQQQQLRPPSSQQPVPPSPLQHQYQPFDQQQNQQSQISDSPTSKISLQNQSQDNMAPSSQNNGRLRKAAADGGQQQSTTSSRESSLLQQPTTQGQPQASQGQPYRGDKQSGETGRATPPPRSAASEMTEEEIEKMIKEYDTLREKYQKVKRYFFEQQTQVHQLQNTLANQRLSLSRTSWDDSEYATRFSRLDGLIAQLSFSIRKDWKSIPAFLHPVVNKNAVEIGKQEMTAVGRAFISHWLVENIFEKYFHPDLEPGFSTQLQVIHLNIRRFAPSCHSNEDEESLAAKLINWRLATLEGLSDLLRAPQAETNRQKLTETLNEKLIASLQMHLNEPAPPDLAGGVPMIVELAVSIAQHLPLESREVHIEYFPPGHGIVSELMKMESGIPPLTSPIKEIDDADRASLRSVASKMDDSASIDQDIQGSQPAKEDKKRGFFGGLGASKKPTTAPTSLGKRESSLGQGGSQQSLTGPPGSSSGQKDELPPPRVRLAVGVAVQIRGKSVLSKAPVYST